MQLRSSLSSKVLILVALPLLVQWVFLAWLINLQRQSEQALERAIHAKDVADAIAKLKEDAYTTASIFGSENFASQYLHGGVGDLALPVMHDYTDLLLLTRHDDPSLHRAIEDSRQEASAGFHCLLDIKTSRAQDRSDVAGRTQMFLEARRHMHKLLQNDLGRVGRAQADLARHSLAAQAHYRQIQLLIMGALALATLGWAVGFAMYLTRGITVRITKVSDNAYRLASDRPLNPVLRGKDEIARLDQTFHLMARALRKASRKERAVVEQARDFICSLDGALKFVAANPASERLLGYKERDLIGQSLVNFVPEKDADSVSKFFGALQSQSGDCESDIETQLCRQGGASIYAMLSAHWSAEEESFFVVVHDMTDRRHVEQLKQEVVLMVTHDLRTPLATLQNIHKFLRSGNFGKLDEKGTEYIMVANRNVERMSNLVNDLLDIEKVKSGLMTLDKQAFELVDCFTAARELAGASADEAGVKIEITPADLMVEADQDRVTRVLANLIANGVTFSPPGGTVRVGAKRDGAWIYTSVDDQGPGIPVDQLQHIFERFRQVDSAAMKGKGGSGLGLTICQAIVELHGGKIWVENLPQQGTRFTFTLKAVD